MCELLGISLAQEKDTSGEIRNFFNRSMFNPHGWGLGYYPDDRAPCARLFKDAGKASRSDMAQWLSGRPFPVKLLAGHVRFATEGLTAYRNTHPFVRECGGTDYIFVHNGKINPLSSSEEGRFTAIGDTDSESLFCSLMNWIDQSGFGGATDRFDSLHHKLQVLNQQGQLNCIFSDGVHLFCYYGLSEHMGLGYTRVDPQDGYIVSSYPIIKAGDFKTFSPGQLIVFKDGTMVYS
ncbi:class II glutamine amidotransferase [Paenibacillus sp. FSL R7-0331]|uniref:class II glutamine amidotransferase n=1 Tax=Paenibacillus sp. FSL R7-0331 TaxID=1536773 RepID=UPI000694A4E0|nr:class II glutamine amidotransferase [Paenibacillus sp. FSL R7-0331]